MRPTSCIPCTHNMSFLSDLFRKKSVPDAIAAAENEGAKAGGLHKNLRVIDLTALGIAAIIGAGIFSTIGSASYNGGPAVIFLFIFTAVACGFAALAYLYLLLRRFRRADRLDHWLGAHYGIRRGKYNGGGVLVGLFYQLVRQRGLACAGMGANRLRFGPRRLCAGRRPAERRGNDSKFYRYPTGNLAGLDERTPPRRPAHHPRYSRYGDVDPDYGAGVRRHPGLEKRRQSYGIPLCPTDSAA